MLSTLQNIRGSQGTLLTQRKRSFHRVKTLTDTAPKGNFDPATQIRFRPDLKNKQHTRLTPGAQMPSPQQVPPLTLCTQENGSWGKQYFWKLSPVVAQGTHYIIVRVLLRHLKKQSW